MAVVINTNVDALKIRNILNSTTTSLSNSMQRMSSGMQILSAKDDAAGTVISAKMKVQLNGTQIAQKNVQNANAMLSTVEGNLDVIEDNITRIRDLTLQAKNGTYSKDEVAAMQAEVQQRIEEINRISESAEFSSLKLFGGTLTGGVNFQVGANDGQYNVIKADGKLFQSVYFSAMTGATAFNLSSIYEGNEAGKSYTQVTYAPPAADTEIGKATDPDTNNGETAFDQAIRALDNAIINITNRKAIIGSAGNRMDSALSALTTQYENLSSAKSIITDSDVAAEASTFTQAQILQQVSTSLLAQANQAPSIAMTLV